MPEPILKVLVGSRAHGLAGADSDADYRGVFVNYTRDILSLGPNTKSTSWLEGKDDDTSYELGHFLFLATKSNPSILEVFKGPVIESSEAGETVRGLFPYVWSSAGVHAAFKGYGHNQRKKMIENTLGRRDKYAVAWLRTLYNAFTLLSTGDFLMSVEGTEIEYTLRHWRRGYSGFGPRGLTPGEVIDTCAEWEFRVDAAFKANPDKQPDLVMINDTLSDLRMWYWDAWGLVSGTGPRPDGPSRLERGAEEVKREYLAKRFNE